MRTLPFLFVAALTTLSIAAGGCSTETSDEDLDGDDGEGASASAQTAAPAATGPIQFAGACREGTSITIAAVGDVLLHSPLQRQAYASSQGHHSLWNQVEPLLARADITYGNLEGPCADGYTTSGHRADPGKTFDGVVYSSYPQFNYHPSLIDALVDTGFDVVSTANNHAMDRRSAGEDRTIDNLRSRGLPFTGTRKTTEPDADWFSVVESKGVRVAFLACTFSTNGIPDSHHQVLDCFADKTTLLSTITALSRRSDVDAVVVTPHWGVEYEHTPRSTEKNLAHAMLDAGALVVLGNHPHVTQPMEKHLTPDGRETFAIMSMGNFVSGQSTVDQRSSQILYLGLTKGADGKTTLNGVRHLPLTMHRSPSWTVVPAERGDSASLALTTKLLGEWNRIGENEELVTNPSCH